MRLDADLRSFILAVWQDAATRKRVADVLAKLPEPREMMCIAKGCAVVRDIDARTLVITEDAIGYGWPMVSVAWKRP